MDNSKVSEKLIERLEASGNKDMAKAVRRTHMGLQDGSSMNDNDRTAKATVIVTKAYMDHKYGWYPIDTYTYDDEPDILFWDGSRIGICHYDIDCGYFLENGWKLKGDEVPTHWMPLPEPPKNP